MSKLKLQNLKLSSFTAELSEDEARKIKGGAEATTAKTYTGITSCCDPTTSELNVSTCGLPGKNCKKKDDDFLG